MSFSNLAAYDLALSRPYWRERYGKDSQTAVAGRLMSMWAVTPGAGAAPTTSAACDNTTAGGLLQPDAPSGTGFIGRITGKAGLPQSMWIVDRLVHQGGLSGAATGEQTTNLPTAALTRETGGVGVFALVEIYTALGGTGTTFTLRYTNTAGTGNRTSQAVAIGNTGFSEVGRAFLVPLQVGDLGVKSVQGITLAASTGSAGNFGITLVKPKMMYIFTPTFMDRQIYGGIRQLGGVLPTVPNGACLSLLVWPGSTSNSSTDFQIELING